jgi:hypothetical protein
LLDAKRSRKSERLSADQLALFAAAWQARQAGKWKRNNQRMRRTILKPAVGGTDRKKRSGGRQPLPKHLSRERIVHDLTDEEKHCHSCEQDLRPIGEESSERYEYTPAKLTVVEDVCKK